MKIVFDNLGSQTQVQTATGSRLTTLWGAMLDQGWQISCTSDPITPGQLADKKVLAILTRHHCDVSTLPAGSHFHYHDGEIAAIKAFVHGGGGLLLLSNHGDKNAGDADWTDNDRRLAAAFDVTLRPAFFKQDSGEMHLTPANSLNTDHFGGSILDGIDEVVVHNSCGVSSTTGVVIARIPSDAHDQSHHGISRSGQDYALALRHGAGRVIIGGNSGLTGDLGSTDPAAGLIESGDNRRFLINCFRYLGGLVG